MGARAFKLVPKKDTLVRVLIAILDTLVKQVSIQLYIKTINEYTYSNSIINLLIYCIPMKTFGGYAQNELHRY